MIDPRIVCRLLGKTQCVCDRPISAPDSARMVARSWTIQWRAKGVGRDLDAGVRMRIVPRGKRTRKEVHIRMPWVWPWVPVILVVLGCGELVMFLGMGSGVSGVSVVGDVSCPASCSCLSLGF